MQNITTWGPTILQPSWKKKKHKKINKKNKPGTVQNQLQITIHVKDATLKHLICCSSDSAEDQKYNIYTKRDIDGM